MEPKKRATGSWILKAIIVLLVALLVYVIYEPYQRMLASEASKKESRARMMNLRTAELYFIGATGYYTGSLDSLLSFVRTDSTMLAVRDSVFKPLRHGQFSIDSLKFSPRTHQPYKLSVDNSMAIKKYLLECPDGYGSIGSLTDDSRINKGSWEE